MTVTCVRDLFFKSVIDFEDTMELARRLWIVSISISVLHSNCQLRQVEGICLFCQCFDLTKILSCLSVGPLFTHEFVTHFPGHYVFTYTTFFSNHSSHCSLLKELEILFSTTPYALLASLPLASKLNDLH